MGLDRIRWNAIWHARRGKWGELGVEIPRLVHYVPEAFIAKIIHYHQQCDHVVVADLIKYEWPEGK